jgi:hypothetical protein
MWSDDPPEEGFIATLNEVFDRVRAEVVVFYNPLLDEDASNTVYLARNPVAAGG